MQAALTNVKRARDEASRQRSLAVAQLEKANALQEQLREFLEEEIANEEDKEKRAGFEFMLAQLSNQSQPREKTGESSSSVASVEFDVKRKLWPNGSTLHIRFIGGDPDLKREVAQIAQEWTKYANLKFVFDDAPDAAIRISFQNSGDWSYLGTDARRIPDYTETMNIGINRRTGVDGTALRRSVLRAFGHALGLINEHQNPNARIPWNKPAVYKQFPYYSKTQVDNSILNHYKGTYRPFDPYSIMLAFPIPQDLLIGNDFMPILNVSTTLSPSDKRFIAELYPGLPPPN